MQEVVNRRAALISYSLLALPLAFAGLPLYLHAPDFYVIHMGLPLASMGAALLLLRLLDAFQDPLIGYLSDKFSGRREEIIGLGLLVLAIGFWMIFHPRGEWPLTWFTLSVFICTTGFSIVTINFHTLGGLWGCREEERIRVTSWREGFAIVGLLAAAVFPALLLHWVDALRAFHFLSLLFVASLAISSFVFFRWMKSTSFVQVKALSGFSAPVYLRSDSLWQRDFFGIYFLSSLASGIPAVLVMFFIRDRLVAPELIGAFLALYFLSGIISMPLWQRVADALGNQRAWAFSMGIASCVFIWAYFLKAGDTFPFFIVCALSGAAFGADLSLPPAILADHIAGAGKQASATSLFSRIAFFSKSAFAMATALSLPVLGYLGYQPGQVDDYAVTDYLSVAYALIPSLIKSITCLWLLGVKLNIESGEVNESNNCSINIGGADVS